MIDGMIIVDAVVHPWNMSPENQNQTAQAQIDAVYASHKLSYDSANANYMRPDQFFRDLDFDALSPLAGVTSVKVRQALDKLWTPDRVNRKVA
jgi:hypothetical protein